MSFPSGQGHGFAYSRPLLPLEGLASCIFSFSLQAFRQAALGESVVEGENDQKDSGEPLLLGFEAPLPSFALATERSRQTRSPWSLHTRRTGHGPLAPLSDAVGGCRQSWTMPGFTCSVLASQRK